MLSKIIRREKQIVVPSENDIFEISKELDPNSGPKFLIG